MGQTRTDIAGIWREPRNIEIIVVFKANTMEPVLKSLFYEVSFDRLILNISSFQIPCEKKQVGERTKKLAQARAYNREAAVLAANLCAEERYGAASSEAAATLFVRCVLISARPYLCEFSLSSFCLTLFHLVLFIQIF